MDGVELRFEALGGTFEVIELVGAFLLVLIVSETAWDLITKQRSGARESLAKFAIGIGNLLLEWTIYGLVFVSVRGRKPDTFGNPPDVVVLGAGHPGGRFYLLLDAQVGT
ncbi:MAG: hypothetical protein L3J36_08300 [Rhodobacteraceae bacterium]|nr:hypothetical protein [Paracoccaceae bacterium]